MSTADPSEGSGHRLGTMRDGYELYFDVRLDEHLPYTIQPGQQRRRLRDGGKQKPVLRTSHASRCTWIVDGHTQWCSLSVQIDKRRSAGRMRGTQSMLQVIGACKPVSRLARGDCSDQHCCPERAWCVVALSMFEYYVYSINHGQESALDGRVRTRTGSR